MEADIQAAFDDLRTIVVGGFDLLGRRLDSLERKVDSLERRLTALEREGAATSVLFGQLAGSLANLEEQVGRLAEQIGRNNARLERLTSMFMESKTEAMVRHGQLERRLLALEERLRIAPTNDPRGSDA